jgi:hypothetical protein
MKQFLIRERTSSFTIVPKDVQAKVLGHVSECMKGTDRLEFYLGAALFQGLGFPAFGWGPDFAGLNRAV